MAKEERWQIASDADLVKRGRVLTVLGVLILCLGSIVTIALMSISSTEGTQRTTAGPIKIAAPSYGSGTSGTTVGGGTAGGTGSTSGEGTTTGAGGPETTGGGTSGTVTGGGTGAGSSQGGSNIDPSSKPAPGYDALGFPIQAATPKPAPPPDDGKIYEF